MSKTEINRAIAEACGWKNIHFYEDNAGPSFWSGIPPISEEEVFKMTETKLHDLRTYGTHIPNYCEDLNAMAEAEKFFTTAREKDNYVRYLCCCLGFPMPFEANELCVWSAAVSATAIRRAEAFLRTLGKWPESLPNNSTTKGAE